MPARIIDNETKMHLRKRLQEHLDKGWEIRSEEYEDDPLFDEDLGPKYRLGEVYINVYLLDQAYGGPEEGGWWYTQGVPVASILVEREWEGSTVAPADTLYYWIDWCNRKNEGERGMYSVLSRGEYHVKLEDHYARYFPEQRPRYE